MTDEEKINAAERALTGLPKRAWDLSREELIDLVDCLQVYLWSDEAEIWKHDADTSGADFVEHVALMLAGAGLSVEAEHDGRKIEPVPDEHRIKRTMLNAEGP